MTSKIRLYSFMSSMNLGIIIDSNKAFLLKLIKQHKSSYFINFGLFISSMLIFPQ